jgi:hypothetical protein
VKEPRYLMAALLAVGVLVAACGNDDDDETAETTTTEAVIRSEEEEEIAQVGNDWAPAFAEDAAAACGSMYGQPLCEEYFGESGGEPAEVGRPSEFQESFTDATVERIEIKGHKAGVEFSNGEVVEFIQGNTPGLDKGDWFIYRVGGNAGEKYFEP